MNQKNYDIARFCHIGIAVNKYPNFNNCGNNSLLSFKITDIKTYY